MDRNGWSDWEHHVLLKLEDQGKKLDRLDEKQDGLKNDIISLESELEKKLFRCRGQCDADIVELKTKLKTGGAIIKPPIVPAIAPPVFLKLN